MDLFPLLGVHLWDRDSIGRVASVIGKPFFMELHAEAEVEKYVLVYHNGFFTRKSEQVYQSSLLLIFSILTDFIC